MNRFNCKCNICGKEFEYKVGLTKHLHAKHPSIDSDEYWTTNYPESIPARTVRRNLLNRSLGELDRSKDDDPYHKSAINYVDDDKVRCPICNKVYKTLATGHLLRSHVMSVEEFETKYPDCSTTPVSRRLLSSQVMKDNLTKMWSDSDYVKSQSDRLRYRHKYDDKYKASIINNSGKKRYSYYSPSLLRVINCRSSWEVIVASVLDDHNIDYEYECMVIKYKLDGNDKSYYPDFYLPKYNMILEVKPKYLTKDPVVQLKKKYSEKMNYEYLFITEENIDSFISNVIKT